MITLADFVLYPDLVVKVIKRVEGRARKKQNRERKNEIERIYTYY